MRGRLSPQHLQFLSEAGVLSLQLPGVVLLTRSGIGLQLVEALEEGRSLLSPREQRLLLFEAAQLPIPLQQPYLKVCLLCCEFGYLLLEFGGCGRPSGVVLWLSGALLLPVIAYVLLELVLEVFLVSLQLPDLLLQAGIGGQELLDGEAEVSGG